MRLRLKSSVFILALAAYLAAVGESSSHIHTADAPCQHSDQSCLICHVAGLTSVEPVAFGLPAIDSSAQIYVPLLKSERIQESFQNNPRSRAPPSKSSCVVVHQLS